MKILLKNGRVIDPKNSLDQVLDILVEGGKVVAVDANLKEKDAEVIDLKGKIVTPGWIDMHVHVREPGREDKESIETFSQAAVKGGVTTACAMPNTTPFADNQAVIQHVVSRAKEVGLMEILPYGCITKGLDGQEITEMFDMKKSGMVGVSDDGFDVADLGLFKLAMKYCKSLDLPIVCHNENPTLSNKGVMHEGLMSTKLGLPGIPPSAESTAIAAQAILAEEVDYGVHFTHVASKSSFDAIRAAKSRAAKVTADITPHHFSLTDEACVNYDTMAKVNPPLRSQEHVDALIEALKDGTVDCIATDHAPHTALDKYVDFQSAAFGISGIETFVALCVNNLVHAGVLDWMDLIAKVTINPARVLKIDRGHLSPGAWADITVIDPDLLQIVDSKNFASKGKNTPFNGMELKGWPIMTLFRGKIVYQA